MTNMTSRPEPSSQAPDLVRTAPWPRYLTALAGTWLVLSIYVWTHTPNAHSNTWIVGFMMAFAAILAIKTPPIRWFNTILAVWLGLSTVAMSDIRPQTLYNNLIVAFVAFVLSLVPSPGERGRTSHPLER